MRSWTHKLFVPAGLTGSVGAQVGAMFAGRGIGFARGVVLAWLLSRREFGMFHVAVAVVNLLVPLCSAGLSHGVLRYAPAHEVAGTLGAFAKRAGALILAVAAFTAALILFAPRSLTDAVFAIGAQVNESSPETPPQELVAIAVTCTVSLILFHFVLDFLRGLRLFRAAGLMDVLGVLLFSSLAVGAPLAGFDSAGSVLLCYGAGNVIAVIAFSPALRRYIAGQQSDPDASAALPWIDTKLVRFSFWIAVSHASWHGLQQYVFWHLAMVGGATTAGTYFAVRLFAQLILLGAQTLSRAISANVTRTWEKTGAHEAVPRLEVGTKVGLMVVFTGAVTMACLKPWVLRAFPNDYRPGAFCLDALLLAYAWFGALEFLLIRFHLEKQSLWTFVTSITGAAANVLLACAFLGVPGGSSASELAEMLPRAGWVCAAGSGSSVFTCVAILTFTGRRPSTSILLLIAGLAFVGSGPLWGAGALSVVFLAALGGRRVFTSQDRALIAEWRRGR